MPVGLGQSTGGGPGSSAVFLIQNISFILNLTISVNININILFFLKRSSNIIQYSYMYKKKNTYMHGEYITHIQKSIFDMKNKLKQQLRMQ